MSRLWTRLLWLPVAGIALTLVGAGLAVDLPATWWDRQGFIVNLASGATAACFGIPLAVFGIQWLLQRREEETRQRCFAISRVATLLT